MPRAVRSGRRRTPALSATKRNFLAALSRNSDVAVAAAAAGTTPAKLYTWRQDDSVFRAAWQRVMIDTCARIEGSLLAQADAQLAAAEGGDAAPPEIARLLAVVKHCRTTLASEPVPTREVDMDELTNRLMDRLKAMVAAEDEE